MSFLRLGVNCAVIDDDGCILLSHRGDLNVWNLPGGRLDSREPIIEAAAREVREETGVVAHVERPVGLYYWAGWERLNILYTGWPLGGDLLQKTDETRANAYFDPRALPEDVSWEWLLFDAISEVRPAPRIIETSPLELRRTKRKLAWRWVKNLLSGRPEPRFPRFRVNAVALLWDESHLRIVTLPDNLAGDERRLPSVICDGRLSPWHQLAERVVALGLPQPDFRWVGLWQDVSRDQIELIFAATLDEVELTSPLEWSVARTALLNQRHSDYVERVKSTYMHDPVWTIYHNAEVKQGETLILEEGEYGTG